MSSRILAVLLAAAAAGCASMEGLTPPKAEPERAYAATVERLRDAFERRDRLAVLDEVDPEFRPRLSQFEQVLIDDFLRYSTIRLELLPGPLSHGPGEVGLQYGWVRTWTEQASNRVERKEGECVFVLREGSGKLVRVDGRDPFAP